MTGIVESLWLPVKDGDPRAMALYRKHYSARHYKDGRNHRLFIGPGEKMAMMTVTCDALFVWRKYLDDTQPHQKGVNCAIFRNESSHLSSQLILEAEIYAWRRWPGERLYTYVSARKIASTNPGYCFQMAGWQKCGMTKGGLVILEKLPEWRS